MAAAPSNRGKPASSALSGNIDRATVAATVEQLRATAIAQGRAEQVTRILARLEDGLHLRLNVLLRSAHWTFRYTSQADGRRHDLGLGGYPRVSVQTAREKAEVLRSGLFLGLDPLVVRRQNIQEQRTH